VTPSGGEATAARPIPQKPGDLGRLPVTRGINKIQQQLIELAKNRTLGTRPAARPHGHFT
jgi:hypothetical protein